MRLRAIIKSHDKHGSVLLLTIIITMVVLSSVVVLGTIIISSLQQGQLQSSAMIAYYASESVMERSLYDYKRVFKSTKEIEDFIAGLCAGTLTNTFPGLDANVRLYCNASVDRQTSVDYGVVKKTQTVQAEIVNADGVSKNSQVDEIVVECTSGTPQPWLEVTRTPLVSGGNWGVDATQTKKSLFSCPATYTIDLDETSSYIVSFRPLYNQTGVKFTGYDTGNNKKAVNDQFTLNIAADYPSLSRQYLRVQVPGKSSLLPFLDYVIYSESNLSKNFQSQPTGSGT